MQTLLCRYQKRVKCFNDITDPYRCNPFTLLNDDLFNISYKTNEEVVYMASDDIFHNNDLEDSHPTDSFDDPQNQEVVSTLLPQRRSAFKLNKMNILANINIFTEK